MLRTAPAADTEQVMKSVLYARVSTTDQNCEVQLRELREFVTRRGWEPAGEYVDAGISGTKASRPALDGLMAGASRREFDCVLVWKLDRFGRSVLHLSQQLAALTSYGVRFIAVSQAIDTDAANPASRLLMTILAGVAEFEREIIRERTLSGLRAARACGKTLGRPRRVLRRDEVVRLRDVECRSWRAIAKHLDVPVSTVRDVYRCAEMRGAFSAGVFHGERRPAPQTEAI
jgi:putative DNA-invertase from lambdoid prophage Rac